MSKQLGCCRACGSTTSEHFLWCTETCDEEVFTNGEGVGFFDMTKEEAEKYCKDETVRTGYKHDWHYVGGRVNVLALKPSA